MSEPNAVAVQDTPAPPVPVVATDAPVDNKQEMGFGPQAMAYLFDDTNVPTPAETHAIRIQSMMAPKAAPPSKIPEVEVAKPADPPSADTAPAPVETPKEEKPADASPAQEEPKLILGKYKSQADLERAYQSLQSEYTRQQQSLANIRKTLGDTDPQTLRQALEAKQWYETQYVPHQQAVQGTQEGTPPAPAVEPAKKAQAPQEKPKTIFDMERDEFLDKFTDDPKEMLRRGVVEALMQDPAVVEQLIDRFVPEVREQRALNNVVTEFNTLEAAHADASEFLPAMKELYAQDPTLKQLPMEHIYWMARGRSVDDLKAKMNEAVTNAARLATESAYKLQEVKKKATVEGAVETQPGPAAGQPDEFDTWMDWALKQKVKA